MFIHQNEGDNKLPSTWQTLSQPEYPGDGEVNRDEKTNCSYICEVSNLEQNFDEVGTRRDEAGSNELERETSECVGGVCTLNWKPTANPKCDVA